MAEKKLKFGVLCNSLVLQQWQANAIKHLLNDTHFELALVVVNTTPTIKNSLAKKVFSSTLFFRQYETRLLKVAAKKPIDMAAQFADVEKIEVVVNKKGKYSQYFKDEDVDFIKGKNLDFLVRFGFGILKGDILSAAKYGIWSYHHGDEMEFRGGPPGFWEIFKSKPTTATVLQRLTPTLDGGIVLKKGVFETTNHSYAYQLNTLLNYSSLWIKQVGLDILYNNTALKKRETSSKPLPINKAPNNLQFIIFLLILLKNKVSFWYNSLFKVELWNIGILKNSLDEVFSNNTLKAEWIDDEEKLSYRADPFVTTINNEACILFERYNYKTNKGHIAGLALNNLTGNDTVLLKTNAHYSYPFIFSQNGKVFCIPESYMENGAFLYEITNGFELKKKAPLIDTIEAVDASLLYYNNKYWLFCTVNNQLHNAQLFVFFSDSLTGEFKPHLLNPVKTDVSSARPAGSFFEYEGSIIRPSQNCSESYGGSLMLNRILTLTETEFKEEVVKEVKPFDTLYNKGIHHISIQNKTIVIDSKRYIYSLQQAIRRVLS